MTPEVPETLYPSFFEFNVFRRQWEDLRLTDKDLQLLQVQIGDDPEAGDVVSGASALRKTRFAAPSLGRGKRGALRVYYANIPHVGVIILSAVFAKNERSDLDHGQLQALVKELKLLMRTTITPARGTHHE